MGSLQAPNYFPVDPVEPVPLVIAPPLHDGDDAESVFDSRDEINDAVVERSPEA